MHGYTQKEVTGGMAGKKKCAVCGKEFVPRKATQQCCSSQCSRIKSGESQRKYYQCQYCGKMFWKPDGFRKKYCSEECQRAAYAEAHPKKEKSPKKPLSKECAYCGTQFFTHYSQQKYCCEDCRYKASLKMKREQWAEAYVPQNLICKECGSSYITECGNTRSAFCCQSCADKYERRHEHRTHRHRQYMREVKKERDLQLRKAFIENVSYETLYERDGGICQICGLPVIKETCADDNWSGTIDHIIPISAGGEHSYENCQLAHRVCNSLKGTNDSLYRIDWERKSKENNYWATKFESLKKALA